MVQVDIWTCNCLEFVQNLINLHWFDIFSSILYCYPWVYDEIKEYEKEIQPQIFKVMKCTSNTKINQYRLGNTLNDKFTLGIWPKQFMVLVYRNIDVVYLIVLAPQKYLIPIIAPTLLIIIVQLNWTSLHPI